MEMREPTIVEAAELLHRTHEALVLHVMDDTQAFAILRSGETVLFPVEQPVTKHTQVHVRPCAAWLAEDGESVRVFAQRVAAPEETVLTDEQVAQLHARFATWDGGAQIWEDVLDVVGGWLYELVEERADDEWELWARRLVEARVDQLAPVGSAPATFDEAVAGAQHVLASLGFATDPDGYGTIMGIAHLHNAHPVHPWFVSHGLGEMDEADAWRGGLVDRVLRRFGFVTVWFGDPRQSIEVQAFRPGAHA